MSDEAKGKPKRGRPPIQFDLEKVKSLAARGLSEPQIALVLGVERNTIRRHRKKDAEFCRAIEEGKAAGMATITNAMFQAAIAGSVPAQQFYLKNRDRDNWRDQQDQHVTGDMTLTIETGVPEDGDEE